MFECPPLRALPPGGGIARRGRKAPSRAPGNSHPRPTRRRRSCPPHPLTLSASDDVEFPGMDLIASSVASGSFSQIGSPHSRGRPRRRSRPRAGLSRDAIVRAAGAPRRAAPPRRGCAGWSKSLLTGVEPWAGSAPRAYAWYRSQPLPISSAAALPRDAGPRGPRRRGARLSRRGGARVHHLTVQLGPSRIVSPTAHDEPRWSLDPYSAGGGSLERRPPSTHLYLGSLPRFDQNRHPENHPGHEPRREHRVETSSRRGIALTT